MTQRFNVRRLAALAVLCLPVPLALAQDSPDALEFAVASIKPIDPSAPVMTGITVFPDGRLLIRATTVKTAISTAFGVALWQISGGEAWTQSEVYSIEAKPPDEMRSQIKSLRTTWTGIDDDTLRAMLRTLLRDRFQLKIHRETKKGTVYTLKQSGQPLKLRPTPPPKQGASEFSNASSAGYAGGRWVIGGMSMRQFAEFASAYFLRAPVLDQTGLQGSFDYRQAEPDPDPKYGDNSDTFLRMIPDLGLRLDRMEGDVETLVIDSVARPSAN
jgi:uncharacterized protein (TIGR03435 family)